MLGALRQVGAGRCAVLGFCPSKYRLVTDDAKLADKLLDNLLAWLLPQGAKPHPWANTIEVCLPRAAEVLKVSVNGQPVANPAVKMTGSLIEVTLPVATIAAGESATVRLAYKIQPYSRPVQTWLHDCNGSFFSAFDTPAQAADFLHAVHANVAQPLLRYAGGSVCYRSGIPGDRPRERIAKYKGDYVAEYLDACHKRRIRVIGGLYLDWQKYDVHNRTAPPLVERDGVEGQEDPHGLVCPLDTEVQTHNLKLVDNLLSHYPQLDGVILDDNFEFDRHPCYCKRCREKFRSYCQRLSLPYRNRIADPDSDGWKQFWQDEMLAFCKRVHDLCKAHDKPVGGWSDGRGTLRFKGVLDFAGDMHYVQPPCSVASILMSAGKFDVYTLLWGMDRKPANMEADVTEAICGGSYYVGFWATYSKVENCKDNAWSLGTPPGAHCTLTPGSLGAIARAFAHVDEDWLAFYRDNLIRGDGRFAVTSAKLTSDALTVQIRNLGERAERRIMGPVDLVIATGK